MRDATPLPEQKSVLRCWHRAAFRTTGCLRANVNVIARTSRALPRGTVPFHPRPVPMTRLKRHGGSHARLPIGQTREPVEGHRFPPLLARLDLERSSSGAGQLVQLARSLRVFQPSTGATIHAYRSGLTN